MVSKKCELCGGALDYQSSDAQSSHYICPYCGKSYDFSAENDTGARLIYKDAKNELFSRLRRGFEDWRLTPWDQLYRDFVSFANAHEHLQNDLQFQMAIIACMTKGFNSIDPKQYQQCKTLFKAADSIYKMQKKEMKKKAKNPALSSSISEYEASRAKFVKLHNTYVDSKLPWKLIF